MYAASFVCKPSSPFARPNLTACLPRAVSGASSSEIHIWRRAAAAVVRRSRSPACGSLLAADGPQGSTGAAAAAFHSLASDELVAPTAAFLPPAVEVPLLCVPQGFQRLVGRTAATPVLSRFAKRWLGAVPCEATAGASCGGRRDGRTTRENKKDGNGGGDKGRARVREGDRERERERESRCKTNRVFSRED